MPNKNYNELVSHDHYAAHNAQVSINNNTFCEISNSKRKKFNSTKAKKLHQIIRGFRSNYPKNIFLGYLNINFQQNKSQSVNELIKKTFDIFLVSESKLDSSFLDSQFSIPSYRIVRKD